MKTGGGKETSKTKYRCLWNTNTPFPNVSRIGFTFDLHLWPTDLNIDRGHLLIKDFLPTKYEASGAKHSWLTGCTRCGIPPWPLTLTFDLLTWISIGIFTHQGLSTYQVWSFWGKAFLSYQLHKVKGDWHTDRRTDRPKDRHVQRNMPLLFQGGA